MARPVVMASSPKSWSWPAICVAVCFLLHLLHRRKFKDVAFFCCLLAGTVGASWLVSIYSGAYNNVYLPGYAGVALCFGLGAHHLLDGLSAERGTGCT